MGKREFVVKHNGNEYDIADFLENHPGGLNYLESSRNRDIARKLQNVEHSKSALYLLREYKIGGRDDAHEPENEDLEKLVDWNKPMLNQVIHLGPKYNEWVASPVDRRLRLFGNSFLERLTITPWYVVPIVWVPVIAYMVYRGSLAYMEKTKSLSPVLPSVLCITLGIIMWTLTEYSLHRWVFHMEPSGSSKLMIYLHFGLHGLHHKVPFDSRRLVFPPIPAAFLAYAGYHLLKILFPSSVVLLLLAGIILGYVMYDMIHFYLHYGSPSENSYFYTMKRYHNQHHFVHHQSGFGISNLYWDKVFGTSLQLRKLVFSIKWCTDKLKFR